MCQPWEIYNRMQCVSCYYYYHYLCNCIFLNGLGSVHFVNIGANFVYHFIPFKSVNSKNMSL